MRFCTIIPAALGSLLVATYAGDARACGGCFNRPPQPNQSGTVVTDHRMIFTISPQATTLYDGIKYTGSPADFAWVLPIRGQVTVGLSSDAVFSALEQATQTSIVAPYLPPCPSSNCSCGFVAGADASVADAAPGFGNGGVTVLTQQTIGPYATVQLKSTDPNALDAWLKANGYDIASDVQPVIAAYVSEGFDFLALKLAPGQSVQSMRPVRVTTPGAGLSLPLRMVAAGTGATVGITLWVIADGRYQPQNFQFFTILPSELTWNWASRSSDYATQQAQKESAFGNAAWQIESSLSVSPYTIENAVMRAPNDYMPLPVSVGCGDAGLCDGGASDDAASNADASDDAANDGTASDGSQSDSAASSTAGEIDAGQAQAQDLAVLFPEGTVSMRVTRMRSDLAHASLANDLVLVAATDQTVISNIYQVTKSVNAPVCPIPPPCNCPPDGGRSGSRGSSSSGGASGGTGDGGSAPNGLSPGGGCAASTSEPGHGGLEFLAASFLGMAILRARRRRTRA